MNLSSERPSKGVNPSARAEDLLRLHRAFEALITNISTEFVNVTSNSIDRSIENALGTIGSFLGIQRAYVFLLDEGGSVMDNTHEWVEVGTMEVKDSLRNIPVLVFPWFAERILSGETVHIPRVRDLPFEAKAEKIEFENEGIISLVNIPMFFKGKVMGFVGFDSTRSEYFWPDEIIDLLRTVGEIFANAISRKRMEEKLRFSEGKYKTLFDLSPQGIVILDMDGKIIDMNETMKRMTDLSLSEIMDHDFRDLKIIHKEYILELAGSFTELLDGKKVGAIEFPVEIGGRTLWLEVHPGLIIIDGEPKGIQVIALDITKRKDAEFEIRMFKSMFDRASFGAAISDLFGRIIHSNQTMEKMHGYAPGELIGSSLSSLHDESDTGSAEGTLALIVKNGGADAVEHRHLRKDGAEIPVLVNGTLILDPKGEPAFISTTVVDISEIHRARAQIMEERYRAEFYLDLLSHDIGNLHQGISAWTSLSMDSPPDSPMRDMALLRIDELQKRALKLVRNVLLLSRLKKMRVELKEVDLVSMLGRSLKEVEHMFPDRKVRTNLSIGTETILYMGEPLMEEIFFNLAQNAYKFIGKADAQIWVTMVRDVSGGVTIRFADNGPGIPDDLKAEVFSRLSRSSKFKNTGIGLSLVKELVERYSGSLRVEDRVIGQPEEGVCFVIELPPTKTQDF